jgi:hypothetical protein
MESNSNQDRGCIVAPSEVHGVRFPQVWITGAPGTTLRSVLASQPILATFSHGAPLVHLTDFHLIGSLRVQGGKLHLLRCSIVWSAASTSRQPNTPAPVRGLSVVGGEVMLVDTVLRGHTAGAIEVDAATRKERVFT